MTLTKILAAVLIGICASPAIAGDVGVSIAVGQPGFFGQINIGNYPQPQLIYRQPVVVQQAPEFISAPPIYLHVPPGHEKHWSKKSRSPAQDRRKSFHKTLQRRLYWKKQG